MGLHHLLINFESDSFMIGLAMEKKIFENKRKTVEKYIVY